jgi:pimeloyl-ACP methyl ester carboxylesterase
MGKGIAVGIVGLIVLLIVVGVLLFWLRPLEVFAWFSRRALTRGGLQKSSVETSLGHQVFWQGGAGPTLVFLHGAGDNAGTWSQVAPRFIDKYRVLVLDLPGHGESALNHGTVSIGVELQGVEEVLDKETNGPLILVGNSMGAFVAMLYADKHPLKVAHLILVNGGAARHEFKGVTLTPANREEARALFDAMRDPGSPPTPGFVLDDFIRRTRNGPLGQLMANRKDLDSHYFLDGHISEVSVPVDLLWGESDRLVPVKYAEGMLKELPNARLTRLPRCGHVPQLECPLSFLRALKQVLSQPPTPMPHGKVAEGTLKEH